MAKNATATNLRSYKRITGLAMGEQVCADHGGDVRIPIKPHMGICYACAIAAGEPVR